MCAQHERARSVRLPPPVANPPRIRYKIRMNTLADLTAQIKEKSHAVVPFPLSHADFQAAINLFVHFLARSIEEKKAVYYNLNMGDKRGVDVGYQIRRRSEGHIDNREFFHYHPIAEEHFRAQAEASPELRALLNAMRHIYDTGTETTRDIIHTLNTAYPGLYEQFFPEQREPRFCLRFLKYDLAEPGAFLAKGHYDRGGCTLALAESAPGLRIGIDDLHLRDVVHDEGKVLFMPALNFPNFTQNEIPPTWHDVIQRSEDAYSNDIARWAIVFFADVYNKPNSTWEDRHRPQRI